MLVRGEGTGKLLPPRPGRQINTGSPCLQVQTELKWKPHGNKQEGEKNLNYT